MHGKGVVLGRTMNFVRIIIVSNFSEVRSSFRLFRTQFLVQFGIFDSRFVKISGLRRSDFRNVWDLSNTKKEY